MSNSPINQAFVMMMVAPALSSQLCHLFLNRRKDTIEKSHHPHGEQMTTKKAWHLNHSRQIRSTDREGKTYTSKILLFGFIQLSFDVRVSHTFTSALTVTPQLCIYLLLYQKDSGNTHLLYSVQLLFFWESKCHVGSLQNSWQYEVSWMLLVVSGEWRCFATNK